MRVDIKALVPVGAHEVDSTVSAATTLTPPAGANRVQLQVIGQNIRYTLDNSTPTATHGFQVKAGNPEFIIHYTPGLVLKIIEETAGAVLQIQYGHEGSG